MRVNTTVVQTLLTPAKGLTEYLTRLGSAVASRLCKISSLNIELMKAEMALPGREVAYIVKARERFGK